jgi:hypothetical protein
MGNGGTKDVVPGGEAVRRAIQWISDRRKEDPTAKTLKLVEEAALKFDLDPGQEHSLFELLRQNK